MLAGIAAANPLDGNTSGDTSMKQEISSFPNIMPIIQMTQFSGVNQSIVEAIQWYFHINHAKHTQRHLIAISQM